MRLYLIAEADLTFKELAEALKAEDGLSDETSEKCLHLTSDAGEANECNKAWNQDISAYIIELDVHWEDHDDDQTEEELALVLFDGFGPIQHNMTVDEAS